MDEMGKLLVLSGLLLALAGAAAWCLGRWGFQGLPGDLRYEAGHVRVYEAVGRRVRDAGVAPPPRPSTTAGGPVEAFG